MNKYQKSILLEFCAVIIVTIIAVIGIIHAKDYVNRSEAIRAMNQLGQITSDYKENYGYIPSETYVNNIKDRLQGIKRTGELVYRGRWIGIDVRDDEILAYATRKSTSVFLKDGYVVLYLDGTVEFLATDKFNDILENQRSPEEKAFYEKP